MSNANSDPRCPECGEPIGQTATYCMHCSADLTDERDTADEEGPSWSGADETSEDGGSTASAVADGASTVASGASGVADAAGVGTEDGQILDPDGFVDNTLTVIVGIVGGIVIGIVATFVLTFTSASAWGALFGLVAWLLATAYLVRRRTVQGAISKTAYGIALVLLVVPLFTLSPLFDVSLQRRGENFLNALLFVAFPAAIAAGIGWVAGKFVPEDLSGSEG